MNPGEIEVILDSIALLSLSCVMVPRLLFFMDLWRLNHATVRHLGTTAYLPKPIASRQQMHDASCAVQRALSRRQRNFRWLIKVHQSRDSIEQAVRIEGVVPVGNLTELNESYFGKAGNQALDIKITVDIYKDQNGSRIVWKYMPNDPSEFQRRRQVFDPAVSFLLSHTNFALLTELVHKA
jgi:hypothetical protein